MMWLILIFVVIMAVMFPAVRCILRHPIKTVVNGCVDMFFYVVRKAYNKFSAGKIVGYIGLFGKGKTLTATHDVVSAYMQFNGKRVWDAENKRFAVQRIHILSNVELTTVPYEKLEDLKQIVKIAKDVKNLDKMYGTYTVVLVLIDEASVQLNSRKFKQNIDALFLNTLLTCRHFHMNLYYTAQRFGQVDALLRQVTSYVVYCSKNWRLQGVEYYDAWQLENATDVLLVEPFKRSCWFVENKHYENYDTYATVEDLEKDCENGDMLSEEKILALQCNLDKANTDGIVNPSKKLKKASKKIRK